MKNHEIYDLGKEPDVLIDAKTKRLSY